MKLNRNTLIGLGLAGALLFALGLGSGGAASPEAVAAVKAGALLVDVRTPGEFASGHVEGAINIPFDQASARLAEFGDKDKPVVLYCRSGRRSAIAKDTLEKAGFKTVYDIGAMSNWRP